MATITTNHIYDPYDQWFTLDYTFSAGVFSWRVTSHSNNGSYRTNIYGLTVNVGGNSYYIGDIAWGNYTPGVVLYSGSTNLTDCTVVNGAVTLAVTGNYYYGTWNTSYRATGSGTQAITPPTVANPTYTVANDYNGSIVAGMSSLTFSFSATPGSAGNTITGYKLFINGVQVYSGATAGCTVTAPLAVGNCSVYVVAVESNGAQGQSSTITITTVSYAAPSFDSTSCIRWSTGDGTGQPADDGTYTRLSAEFVSAKIDGTAIATYCKISVLSYNGTISSSGSVLYTGSILSLDNSYLVTYELYDAYVGSGNAIVRTDTISIGGRAFDLIHDPNDGYGAAVNGKSEPGKFIIKDLILDFEGNCLWTSTATTFAAQTVQLDLSEYSHIIIGGCAWDSNGGDGYFENIIEVGKSGMLSYNGCNGDNASNPQSFINMVWRAVSVTSTGVTFGQGEMVYAGGVYRGWNNRCVPMWIWGFKKPRS